MKKTKIAAAVTVVMLALAPLAFGQDRFQASLNFLMGYPQSEFRANVDRTFYGLSGEFLCRLRNSPFSFGVSLEYLNYGSETRTERWDAEIPEVWVDVTTRNSLLSIAAVLRLSPETGVIRPYVEGLVGFNYLFTYTSVSDDDAWSEDIATTTNFDDWALTYGVGTGAILRALEVRNRLGPFHILPVSRDRPPLPEGGHGGIPSGRRDPARSRFFDLFSVNIDDRPGQIPPGNRFHLLISPPRVFLPRKSEKSFTPASGFAKLNGEKRP